MSTELKYLAFTALLTASLWIPFVVAQVATNGFLTPPNYIDPTPRPLPDWGKRADRTYINAVETFAPFAALVLLIQVTGKADSMTAFWAIGYFWLRLAHAVVFLIGLPYIRTLIFVLAYVCVIGLFVELVK
ncbi:MAG: MAPEG family protein [Xanthobacteraceae bacterium]